MNSNHLMVFILRSQDIISDSRILRYEKWFQAHDISYRIVGWDRSGKNLERPYTVYCKQRAGYHQREKAILNRLKWNFFLLKYLFFHRKEYNVIHACDFDTILPALIFKFFGKKVVFDIFDWFSDEVRMGKIFVDKLINLLEKWAVRMSDLTIICEKERLEQIDVVPSKYIVISNIPEINNLTSCETINDFSFAKKINVAYVGGIVPNRGIEELVEVVSLLPNIRLRIAGFGDKDIEKKVIDFALSHDNICFCGKVTYDEAVSIMRQADIIYAMYYKENLNHIYAAPNKYYEAIFLNKPLITTSGTLVGKKVKTDESGFVIDEGKAALQTFFKNLSVRDIVSKKGNICKLADIYRTRFDKQMNIYKKELNLLIKRG